MGRLPKDVFAKIPDGERPWVTYQSTNGKPVYILTGTALRDKYYLYVNESGKYRRLGECGSPGQLVERFRVLESLKKI